jgi:GNAT superfamily N-acetyltransferase
MPDFILKEENRKKLDGIVSQMVANKESDSDIQLLVEDFKSKYGEKKNHIQNVSPIGTQTSKRGFEPFLPQVPTETPSVLNEVGKVGYEQEVQNKAQQKQKLSEQLRGANDVYYQSQGDASSFSLYDGFQASIKKIDDEIAKNYAEDATVSRTVSGQDGFEKYKARREQLISDRDKFSQLSKDALRYINPTLDSNIKLELKDNGLDKFTRVVGGYKVPDEFKIDDYAKKYAEQNGVSDGGTFKKLVYDKLKSSVSSNIIEPEINKVFVKDFKSKYGVSPNEAIEKDFLNNFVEGKKIQSNLILQVDSLNNEIKTKLDEGVKSLVVEYKPRIESINTDYKKQTDELEFIINQLNESYKTGAISRQDYELAFNNTKAKFDIAEQQYKQVFDGESKTFLNNQNELFSKYNKRFKRQVSEFESMADQQLSDASRKYGKEYKISEKLKNEYESLYREATKKYLSKEEAIKYDRDRSSILNNLGGQYTKNLLMGIGGGIKSLSSMYDFDTGYVLGDYLENSFTSSSPEIKSGWDLLDPIKVQSSVGRMLGGMSPILASSALTAAVTKNAPTAIRLLTTGLSNYLIETAQIGGGVKEQVFQKTGNVADANKAAKKVMDANLYLLPLYALDGLPFLGNVTLGIKNTFLRAGAKAGIEVVTELPQEYFQSIFEDLAVADRPISDTFRSMTLEKLENTALNVIPTSVLLGGGGTAIQGVRESISKVQGRSFAAKVDLANLTKTAKNQFVYDTVLRRGEVFSKAYISSLFNSGNINEQEMESFSAMLEDSANIMKESKKLGLNKSQSKVFAALMFDYSQSKQDFDLEQDGILKNLYKAKMDAAEKSIDSFVKGGKPDAVLLTLPNKEQYVYSFETLSQIIDEGGEIVNQILNGEVEVGLLSDKTNPKAKELYNKIINSKQEADKKKPPIDPPATGGAMVEEADRIAEIESVLSNDDAVFAEEGQRPLLAEARVELKAELEKLRQEQGVKKESNSKVEEVSALKDVESASKSLEEKYGIILDLTENKNGDLSIGRIIVPKENRGKGVGKKAMQDIVDYADKNGRRILLTPSIDFGATSVARLKEFYKEFGFIENKGKNKDFTTKDSMYRNPQLTQEVTPAQEVEQLRAEEQAEYDAMADPKDKAERQKIYDKYDKLITPLLPKKKTKPQEDATQIRKVEQSNIPKREGVTEQQQGEQEDRVNQKEPVSQAKAETGGSDSVVESREKQEVTAQEKDTVSLPPRIQGGTPQNFVFSEGEWKQRIGKDLTEISKGQQKQVNDAFVGSQVVAKPTQEAPKVEEVVKDEMAEMEEMFAKLSTPPTENQGVSATSKSAINNLKTKTKDTARVKIIESAQKLINTLQSVFPNMDIFIHDNEGSYNAAMAMADINGVADSGGNFSYIKQKDDSITGRIDINLNKADARTVAHEVAHAIMLKAFGENPALFKNFRDRISKVLSNSANKKLMDFAAQYEGDVTYEEYIVELTATLSEQKGKISPTVLQQIADVINDIVSKLTQGKFIPFEDVRNAINNASDVLNFLNNIAESISKGEEIKIQDRSGEVGVFNIPKSKSQIKAPKASEDKRDFIRNLVQDIDFREFNGKPFVTNMYDYTTAGVAELGNGFKINMLGGKNYVPYMMSLQGKKIGDVSNLAAFNTKAQAEGFKRNAEKGNANLFAPHAGTLSESWQFQQHTFAELVDLVLDSGILKKSELIDTFNNTIENSQVNKKAFQALVNKYKTNISDFNSFVSDPKRIVELLDVKNNFSPNLRKALNNSIASNKIFQKALGIKNKQEFYNSIKDPLNENIIGGEIMGLVDFDPNTFEIVKTNVGDIDHHPSFGWTLKAKINGIYQPTEFHKSVNVTDSYTKYNKAGAIVANKEDSADFEKKNVSSSAGSIPKIAEFKEPVLKANVVDDKIDAVRKLEVEAANRVKKLGDALGFGLGKPVSKSQLSNTPLPVNTSVANGFDTLKKKFGETAAKAIRENIPFALDYPTEFAEFITKKIPVKEDIAFVVKNLSQRLDGLFRLESDKNIETVNVKNKTPEELSKEAGYVFHRPESENDILAFKKDFENGEVLCTYNDVEGRMQGHFIFWLRRNDAESVLPAKKVTQEYLKDDSEGSVLWRGYLDGKGLKMADGSYDLSNLTASRQDPYGTSSMSVQIGRRGGNISIKNRYNHTVNNPDATFGNDLNTIIDGLNDAVFGIEGVPKAGSQELSLPDNITSDTKGRFFKYDSELENIYVSQHGYVYDGEITLIDKSYQRMIDDYVFDSKRNAIQSVTMSMPIIKDITNINFEKNKITVDSKDGKFEFELVNGILNKLESDAGIINSGFLRYNNTLESVSLPNVRKINDDFLYLNKKIESISLPNVEYIGETFLRNNIILSSISLPKVKEIGRNFLYRNKELESISLPNIEDIGHYFLYSNENIKSILLPNVKKIADDFLYYNTKLRNISLPNVEEISGGFLSNNTSLKSISLPNVEKIGNSFLPLNKMLEDISLPSAKYIGSSFIANNDYLNAIDLPNVEQIGSNFLKNNYYNKSISLPSVKTIENNFLKNNKSLESISLPKVERIGSQFLYYNQKLKTISLPKIEKIGDYFMINNESVERPTNTWSQPTSKSQLSPPNIAQLIDQARSKGISDTKIEEFLKSKGFSTDDIQSAMGKKVATKQTIPSNKVKEEATEDTDVNVSVGVFSDVAVSNVKASGDLVRLANKNIDSDEFRDTLSNKPRESGRALSEEDKKLRVKKLMDAFKLGVDIIEKAKEDFGDKYVENLLAFVRDNLNSLGVDNVSLILISLENDLNKQMLEDPDNLTLQKQERLVQNITIKFQRSLARGLGYGRLRQIARVGYDVEAVTDQFFTTKQLQGRAKVEKAIQSDMDAINEEAESQEQDSEAESEFLDEDIQRLIEEGVEAELGKLKVTMPTNRRQQADKAIAAIEKFQKKLRGLTYESIIGVPIAFIDSGLTTIKVAIDKGVNVVDAIELGIKKIKRDYKKSWDKEDKFRKDMLNFFKKEGVELKEGKRVLTEDQKRKMYIKRLEKDLDDLDTQIEEKKRKVVTREDKYKNDQEIQSLRETKEAKQEMLNKVDPSYAERVKLKNDLNSAQKSLDEYERKINENDFEPSAKPSTTQIDSKLKELRDKRDTAKQEYQDKKKAFEASLITPESIEEKKIDSEIKATEKSIAELERRLDEKDFGTDTKTQSVWTQKIGELKQKQSELRQKLIEERNKLIQKQAPKDNLTKAKDKSKERIAELEQEIADKKKELKIRNKPETDAELVALQQQEKALKAVANQYLTQESIDQINDSKEKAIVTKLEKELSDLDEQISKQEKVQKEKKDPLSTPAIEQLKAIRKAKIDLLNQIDPNPKEFTKQALIEAGYGREITVTRKGGIKEKIQVLDWKKLAGEEGSIDNISAIVAQTLKDKGFSDVQIGRMKDAFVQEIKDLRESIVEKAVKELERQNKQNPSPSRRSSARRLAELYDLGLFEKNPDEFKYLLNKALGLSDLGQEAFFESEQFAKALKGIYAINSDEFFSRQFIREINLKISRLLNKVAMQEGSTLFKFATVASEIANLMLRVKLQTVKQFLDNQISGRQERLIQDIGRFISTEISDKEYEKMVKRYGKIIKDDITKNAGLYYGDINTPFLTKSQIEDYVNGMTKNRFYHYMISMALGKSYLEGADSMNKANLTEVIFRSALLKVMTDDTNPNSMTDEEASKFINESLFGQKFDEALQESARIIRKINTDAGIEILAETKENVYRGAMDLVKANLLSGGVVNLEMIEASFDAAYTVAGYGLGHEANNPISRGVNTMQQVLEAELKKSIQEKEWGKASIQTAINIVYRNILNPFVGGGANWVVLGLQLSGIDVASPIAYWVSRRKNRVDIGNQDDMKLLEKQLVDDFRRKTVNRRYLIGSTTAALFTLAFYASGGDDEYEKWLERNKWFKRYEATVLPRMTLLAIVISNGTLGDWAINTFSRSAKFDALPKLKEAYKLYEKGNEPAKQKAYGELGNVVGQKFDLPFFSIRFMRDIQGIFKGIRGDVPEKSDFKNIGTLNGFFNYGGLDLIGYRPERTYMRNIEGYIPYADKETISFLRERNLDINANSDEAVLRNGVKSYITMDESPKYDKLWNNEVYKSIKTNMPKLKDLNEKQVKTFVTAIEYVATQKVQKEFGFKDASLQQIEINDVKYSFNKAQIAQREKFINTYLIDNKGSEDFNKSFKKAVRDGRAVNSIESRIKMKMTNAKSHATKKMKEIYEYNTKALTVTPK